MAINLQKGQRINLEKSTGVKLVQFCIGVNWGAIEYLAEKDNTLGFDKKMVTKTKDVDLDLSCVMYDENNNLVDYLYSPLYRPEHLSQFGLSLGKLVSITGAMRHAGDDLKGDKGGNDGIDNEVITVDLSKLDGNIRRIFFFLNDVSETDFAQIPYTRIRMYEGTPTKVDSVYAEYNVVSDSLYKDKRAIIMGELYKKGDDWKFCAIGDVSEDTFLGQTVQRISRNYAK